MQTVLISIAGGNSDGSLPCDVCYTAAEIIEIKVSIICLNFRIPKIIDFPFGTNGKFISLVVPVLKLITLYCTCICSKISYTASPQQSCEFFRYISPENFSSIAVVVDPDLTAPSV